MNKREGDRKKPLLFSLYHYFKSSRVEKGVDFITTSKILEHSKTMVSLGYTHTSKERKKRAVDLLN